MFGYIGALPMSVKTVVKLVPIVVTVPMTQISPAIGPYSMAVAPQRSLANREMNPDIEVFSLLLTTGAANRRTARTQPA